MKFVFALASIVVLVSACSDPKTASKQNFETVINDWISKNPPCIAVPRSPVRAVGQTDSDAFPRYAELANSEHPLRIEAQKRDQKPFEALADAGLMKAEQVQINVDTGPFGSGPKSQMVMAYNLTPEGEKALSSTTSRFTGPTLAFCYGVPVVKEIVRFTEPGDMMGATISRVEYTYHLKDLPAWTTTASLQTAFPQVTRDSADTLQGQTALVLTNEGWIHEKAAKF